MSRPGAWTPASHCPGMDWTLAWGQLAGPVYGWIVADGTGPVAATAGFPAGMPPVTAEAAVTWADTVAGRREWIEQPPRSGAFHAHPAGTTCPGGTR